MTDSCVESSRCSVANIHVSLQVMFYASSIELSRDNAAAIIAAGDPDGEKGGLLFEDFASLAVFNSAIGRPSALPAPPDKAPLFSNPPAERDYHQLEQWASVWAQEHLLGVFHALVINSREHACPPFLPAHLSRHIAGRSKHAPTQVRHAR